MKINCLLRVIVENITGRKCSKCKHLIGGVSCDNLARYADCSVRLYPAGFEKKGGERVSYKDDYEKLNRIYFLKKEIPKLQQELARLENHFNNKKKVNSIVGYKERNGCKPLLGLFNKVVYHPSAYCELKQCYLLYDDMREKSCHNKGCKHLIILDENQKKKGIKNMPMKFYDITCEKREVNEDDL